MSLIVFTVILYILLPELSTSFDHELSMSFSCFSRQIDILYSICRCIRNETEINGTVNVFRGRRDKLRCKHLLVWSANMGSYFLSDCNWLPPTVCLVIIARSADRSHARRDKG